MTPLHNLRDTPGKSACTGVTYSSHVVFQEEPVVGPEKSASRWNIAKNWEKIRTCCSTAEYYREWMNMCVSIYCIIIFYTEWNRKVVYLENTWTVCYKWKVQGIPSGSTFAFCWFIIILWQRGRNTVLLPLPYMDWTGVSLVASPCALLSSVWQKERLCCVVPSRVPD